jgi:hypothetical protein
VREKPLIQRKERREVMKMKGSITKYIVKVLAGRSGGIASALARTKVGRNYATGVAVSQGKATLGRRCPPASQN